MPEATAQLKPPALEHQPVVIDQKLNGIRQGVSENAGLAMGTSAPNVIPAQEQDPELSFIPRGGTVQTGADNKTVKAPGTFLTETNDTRHYVDFSGEGAPVRTGPAGELHGAVEDRKNAVQQEQTNPTPKNQSPWEKFDIWIHTGNTDERKN